MTTAPDPIPHLPRQEVIRLCELLGHDPMRVSRIVIEYDSVDVVYAHPVQ